jgi:hypothetical protein
VPLFAQAQRRRLFICSKFMYYSENHLGYLAQMRDLGPRREGGGRGTGAHRPPGSRRARRAARNLMPHLTFIANVKTVKRELPEAEKSSKASVSYTDHTPLFSRQCQFCENYLSPGRCRSVKDPISIDGWCQRFERAS